MRAFLGGSAALVTVVTLALVALVPTGCSSSKSEDSAESEAEKDRAAARQYYVARVHPASGSCVACHAGAAGPRFMSTDPEESYDTLAKTAGLVAAPKNSPLVQYLHKDPTIAISPEQRSVITQWLSLEATARGLEGAVAKPKTLTEAYKQYADCMNFDVWSYYRMGDVAFTQTDSEGPCLGCHSTGQGSAWLSAGSRESFEKARQFPFIQKLVVGKLDERGSFESLQPSNRLIEKANEPCAPEAKACHPSYGLPPQITEAVKNYVDTTLQNLASGTCAQGIVVPQDAGPKDAGDGG
jgi:mono/diheme cytochrome c family protein